MRTIKFRGKEMNYEERYKKAVQQIRDLLERSKENGWLQMLAFEKDFEQIFPELRESEDESIRKVLTDYFKRYQDRCADTFDGVSVNAILAWLEKQGQSENKTEDPNDDEKYADAISRGWVEFNSDGMSSTLRPRDIYNVGFYDGYEFGKKLN